MCFNSKAFSRFTDTTLRTIARWFLTNELETTFEDKGNTYTLRRKQDAAGSIDDHAVLLDSSGTLISDIPPVDFAKYVNGRLESIDILATEEGNGASDDEATYWLLRAVGGHEGEYHKPTYSIYKSGLRGEIFRFQFTPAPIPDDVLGVMWHRVRILCETKSDTSIVIDGTSVAEGRTEQGKAFRTIAGGHVALERIDGVYQLKVFGPGYNITTCLRRRGIFVALLNEFMCLAYAPDDLPKPDWLKEVLRPIGWKLPA